VSESEKRSYRPENRGAQAIEKVHALRKSGIRPLSGPAGPRQRGLASAVCWADTTKLLCRLNETALQQRPAIGTRVLQGKWASPAPGQHYRGGEEMIIRRDWTPREDAILQQGALTGQTVGEIARKVGRTMSAVLTRARNHQIKLRRSASKSLSAPADGLMA
jgi:hypothetical protein